MARDYSVDKSAFYTIGKDFAFDWIKKNPDASREQLIEAILDGQKWLPSGMAQTVAERIANRVLLVIQDESKSDNFTFPFP